jgi:glycogen operon protein
VSAPIEPGAPGPLGAHVDGDGINVAVWSRHANAIELCVFDATGTHEIARHPLPGRTGDVRHGRLRGAGPGLVYGLRAHGPYAPREGHRFNPHKLLLDPHARELVGAFRWDDAVLGYQAGHPHGCDSFDVRDSAPFVPKARVPAPHPPAADRPPKPGRPWGETVLYELHVKGYTATHPRIQAGARGTVEALAHPESIAHLRGLGVTAVELLPIAAWLDELHLVRRGLANYWGYNPIAFTAIQPALAGPRGLAAMRDAVDALHAAGIEVILDVVFNHTGEGDERGPTLSLRGLDNASYYVPDPQRPGGYRNLSGCGNTLAAWTPQVGALILEALRFWAGEVGVDGFRFDLASAIARGPDGGFDPHLPWIRALREDPLLARCKLIAEGWDCEGHFVGGFPAGWSEWNDRYRDDVRRFWLGRAHGVGALATRLAGSSDLFGAHGRGPAASIDYVTAHDGFTLADTVSYSHRRNHANGEGNRDGHAHEVADGGGAEGPTEDRTILARRARRVRAMLATLMLSRGVPMLRAGDEFGATQHANNNAYCQDGPLTWLSWPDAPDGPAAGDGDADGAAARAGDGAADPTAGGVDPEATRADLRGLVGTLARLRAAWPCLRAEWFLSGSPSPDADALTDVAWLREDGEPMAAHDWHDGNRRALAVRLDAGVPAPGAPHDRVWIGLAAAEGPTRFVLPPVPQADGWIRVLDTAHPQAALEVGPAREILVEGPAVVVCAAGAIARAERARWRRGVPAALLVPADDPTAALEMVLADTDLPADVSIGSGRATGPGAEVAIRPIHVRVDAASSAVLASAAVDGEVLRRRRVRLPRPLPPGAHPLCWPRAPTGAGSPSSAPRASGHAWAHPPRCHLPEPLRRAPGGWALSVQLYGLASAQSWGIGDFADLAALGVRAAGLGAAGLLVSPVHAPSFGWPDRGSPYSPSSRLALNPLFVSLPRAARAFPAPRFDAWVARDDVGAAIDAARAAPTVDHRAVTALKRAGLERLWLDLLATAGTARAGAAEQAFRAWLADAMPRLRGHLLFEALADVHGVADRRAWPAGFEHPDTDAVRAFEHEHAERVRFHGFVLGLAERQWREAGDAMRSAGAPIGPIADLAVGADPAGAATWSRPAVVAEAFEIGAPPDAFAADGQAWGLPPWAPEALAEGGHAPFVELLRATMAGAGGLRIDHVMALERLFWVRRGGRPADGAYVAYPLEDLLRIVVAESARARCLVIGEDLGTVRPGLRERLATAGVLSYKVAWFERASDGTLADPGSLPALAAVSASTHDLPTIDGWVLALDVDERERLGAIDAGTAARLRAGRRDDVARLEAGLARAGCGGEDLVERLHRWLAASSCRLAIVQLEDVAGLRRQPNLPGTPDVAPNWRQPLPVRLEALDTLPRWRALASIFAARRAREVE